MQPTTISPSSDGTRMTRRTATAAARPKRHTSPPTVPAKPAVRAKRAKKVDAKAPSKEREPKYVVMGMLADVRDDKGRWSEARVIDVDVDAQKVKVHFLGWHKRFDTWAVQSAIAPHGARVAGAKKDEKSMKRSHLNATHLFGINPKYIAHEKDSDASEEDAEASTIEVPKEASRGRPRKRKVTEAKAEVAQPERSPSPPAKQRKTLRATTVTEDAAAPAALLPPASPPVAETPMAVERLNAKPSIPLSPLAQSTPPMRPLTAAREMSPTMAVATPPAMQPQSGFAPTSTKTVLAEIFRQRVQQQIAELVENQKGKVAKKQQQQHKTNKAPPKQKRSEGMPFPPVMPTYQTNMAAFHRPLQANAAFLQESIDAWRAQQENLMKDITSVVCL
ncbi:hypothetical protein SPRG_20095 [Saprolegnia parasitica CBS 223.65]|uniref:Tudor-knot domain-containing protein n=1 Tax=Saprolegnia parasitica (strain CBS 223.65) TaxID=695850 RepID=A0A067CDZ2_SAPPC|nr:hypothetical protein SPRG_20095 [Saprolegnia parasitica CBS 223.65]KDO28989.1 hypothetical protein SPRG_20095 [Saprolegnia parasitica CBS 223.65]|eukprot:XP_012200321.1 hypothetical protein SPRG_20095 [Saprolegnia parasitica CBS 223.65]